MSFKISSIFSLIWALDLRFDILVSFASSQAGRRSSAAALETLPEITHDPVDNGSEIPASSPPPKAKGETFLSFLWFFELSVHFYFLFFWFVTEIMFYI